MRPLPLDTELSSCYNLPMDKENERDNETGGYLSGNVLKLIACASMLADHMGMLLFPSVTILRAVGRLAMPLFAFAAAEGFRYTRNKLTHFLIMLAVGLAVSGVFSLAEGAPHFDILITFSLSALVTYALQSVKKNAFAGNGAETAASVFALLAAVALAVFLCLCAKVEYGIAGVMLPVAVRLTDMRAYGAEGALARADTFLSRIVCFSLGLVAVSLPLGGLQWLCLFAIPLVALYNGKRGKARLKYFFYFFYVGHFIVLGLIYAIIRPDVINAIFGRLGFAIAGKS